MGWIRRSRAGVAQAVAGLVLVVVASTTPVRAAETEETASAGPVMEVFTRPGCPHCADAAPFVVRLERERPELRVIRRDVIREPAALARLEQLVEATGTGIVAVPAFYVHGRLFIGFDSADTSGRRIEAWLDLHEAGPAGAAPVCDPDESCQDEPGVADVPIVGTVSAGELGLPAFTIVLGVVDGFNPCAMWVLLFLLSLLVNLRSRARMAIVGGTFIAVSGAAYYAFMAAWLQVFLIAGYARALQLGIGVVAIGIGLIHVEGFFARHRGGSPSIPESAEPGLYARVRRIVRAEDLFGAMLLVVGLAVVLNLIELLCTAGLPAIYTQILSSQGIPAWKQYLYLLLYIVAYMLDDVLVLTIAVVTLSRRELQERAGRWLALVSGAVMVALGVLLVLAPGWLTWS